MIFLREICREDLPTINLWRNRRDLVRDLGAPYRIINSDAELAWYENYLKNRISQVRCAICLEGSGELVGLVSLTGIDYIHRNAEYHIMLWAEAHRRRGIGTLATQLILEHGFKDLNLHRIYLWVLAYNDAAIRLYRKVGFTEEGRGRECAYKEGSYHDLLLMGLLREEFRKARAGGRRRPRR